MRGVTCQVVRESLVGDTHAYIEVNDHNADWIGTSEKVLSAMFIAILIEVFERDL